MQTTARPTRSADGFTLIELLVVMGIIGVLAGLTVGLSTVAGRSSKMKRMESELSRLVTEIENYKSEIGNYPRDNPANPALNSLFYELSGSHFEDGAFTAIGQQDRLGTGFITEVFNAQGFGNSARTGEDPKFKANFKPEQHKKVIEGNVAVEILIAPYPGPSTRKAADGTLANPWNYVRTNPTHNKSSFDLWVDITIGSKTERIDNW